jgi:hypothetical protein
MLHANLWNDAAAGGMRCLGLASEADRWARPGTRSSPSPFDGLRTGLEGEGFKATAEAMYCAMR